MSTTNTYLAVFTGSKTSTAANAWAALSDSERRAKEQQGMAGWMAWMAKHKGAIVDGGGPLGKTKRVGPNGVSDVSNELGAFVVVHASSHEDAAKMFEGHPHFTIFPGDGVDVMPLLPIPGA